MLGPKSVSPGAADDIRGCHPIFWKYKADEIHKQKGGEGAEIRRISTEGIYKFRPQDCRKFNEINQVEWSEATPTDYFVRPSVHMYACLIWLFTEDQKNV